MSTYPSEAPKPRRHSVRPRRLFAGLDLRDLELFACVAEAGSITHGAQHAHLSLPAASGRLQAMERAIGTSLLVRGRRGVTLTPAGRLLRDHAATVLTQIDRMRGDLTRFADGLIASIRLQANTSATETFLPAQLTAFLARRPQIDIDLHERPSREIVPALMQGHADLGIVASSHDTGGLICHPVVDDQLVLTVPPGHDLGRRRHVRLGDCLNFPLIGLSEGRALAEHLNELARPHGDRPLHRIRLPTMTDVCKAVAAGLGVAIVPQRIAGEWETQGALATVALNERWAYRTLLLCRAPNAPLSAPGRDLHAYLTDTPDPA